MQLEDVGLRVNLVVKVESWLMTRNGLWGAYWFLEVPN